MGQARDEAGNIWETDAQGNAVRLISAADQQQGDVFTLPPDPVEQARLNIAQNADTRAQSQAGLREDLLRAQIAKTEADAARASQAPAGAARGLTAKARADAIRAYTDADALDRIAAELENQFEEGPGATSGVWGLQDYFPTGANQRFDDTSFQARGYVKRGLGFTGGEGNTVGEIGLNYGPYLPEASDRDERVPGKIEALRNLANDSRRQAIAVLGGIPDANGQIMPVDQAAPQPNPLTALRIGGSGGGSGAAGFGADQGNTITVPPELNAEKDALVAQLMQQGGGRIDPDAYARGIEQIVARYPGIGIDPESSAQWARDINDYLDSGGKTVPAGVQLQDRDLSMVEQGRNMLVSNPLGAAAAGFADMGGFGGVSMLAPDQMAALGDAGGWTGAGLTAGQIAGSITGTAALGKLGAETLGRVAPGLLQGGRAAQFGRNLGTDVAYSGIYGGAADGDPLTGAAMGGAGSVGGQLVGKGLGRVIGGLDVSPAVQALRNAGVRLTTGQTLGGLPRRLEDAFTSIPGVGDMASARRLEGLQDFNRAAFGEAGAPIGATVQNIGEAGVQELLGDPTNFGNQGAVGRAYDAATAGVRVPLDPQFNADMAGVANAAQALPEDYAARFDVLGRNRIGPILDAGELTGEGYQQAFRGLRGSRSSAAGAAPGFEQEYRDAITLAMDALTGQVQRGGGQSVIDGLANANQANRAAKTLERAVQAAKNGTGSGEIQTFTPAQLNTASTQAANRFGGGRQMAGLIDAGQSTLPSTIPDSGTGRRIATMALPTALGGTGAALGGYTSGGDGAGTGAISGLALAALLMAGGTRGGQRAMNTVLTDRPAVAQMLGRQMRSGTGLLGAVGRGAPLPFLISDY